MDIKLDPFCPLFVIRIYLQCKIRIALLTTSGVFVFTPPNCLGAQLPSAKQTAHPVSNVLF